METAHYDKRKTLNHVVQRLYQENNTKYKSIILIKMKERSNDIKIGRVELE